jgi:hypothetical protein
MEYVYYKEGGNGGWGRHTVAQLVEALRYKPESRGFDSRWGHWIFHWLNPSDRTTALESTQPRIEMSTRNTSWEVKTAGVWMRQTFHLHVPQPSTVRRNCTGMYRD